MQIARLKLQDFRGIVDKEYSFADELGRVNKVTLIVGPNGSGKSSILDAIWFGLQKAVGYKDLRRNFRAEPEYIVRTGKSFTQVEFSLCIDETERQRIQLWKQDLIGLKDIAHSPETWLIEGSATWTYPPQPGYDETGYRYQPKYTWSLLKGKDYARRLKRLQAHVGDAEYHLAGGVYLFEQERQIIAERKSSVSNGSSEVGDEQTPDILNVLVDLGIKSKLGQLPSHDNWYRRPSCPSRRCRSC